MKFNKLKNIVTVLVFGILMFSISAMCYFGGYEEYSDSERRPLAVFPAFTKDTVLSGDFMTDFEEYTTDQFPYRDKFRSAKALFLGKVLNKMDNNGVYYADGHISKIDEKENEYMLNYSAELFRSIYEKNIIGKNANVYFSIVPGKNVFLAQKNGYPYRNYENLKKYMVDKTSDFMTYIDIDEKLSLDYYYTTDSHWKQEKIGVVAKTLAETMGTDISAEYTVKTLDNPFYGVYTGQSALPVKPDTIKYLTNDELEKSVVTYYSTGKPQTGSLYNMDDAYGKDPYEMFLSGTEPLIVIENSSAKTEKELVMFRDSFASSLAPLMVSGYKKITLVDIRYMQSSIVGNFVDFADSDVLFIYSDELLNNSLAMK